MPGIYSQQIILIDTSSFGVTELHDDLVDHVKEAVSFQISRGAITNKKLIRLGVVPYLARVKWTFFDSTLTHTTTQKTAGIGQYMKTLNYNCWDLFEKELNEQVKSNSPIDINISVNSRMKNVVKMLENLKFQDYWTDGIRGSNPDLVGSGNLATMASHSIQMFIIVFTAVPKLFSSLVHLAAGITNCKHSLSLAANCSPEDIQMCFVDVRLDSISLHDYTGLLGKLPSFWDDICSDSHILESQPGKKLSLKVSCLKKIMMIHKLMEMRFPWMYDHALPFGFGLGMKRLHQWERTIPHDEETPKPRRSGCLSLRKCCSEEMYYLDET